MTELTHCFGYEGMPVFSIYNSNIALSSVFNSAPKDSYWFHDDEGRIDRDITILEYE